ncbi:MAG: PilZ domain-containing protein [Candidatus Omnitrophica bacterium]|nr:PilZ domain-containing protein [Candidatus Omnitrophota bacterium]
MQEKRKSSRLQEPFPVRQRAQDAKSAEVTQAKNISTGGMRIITDSRFDIGSKLNMEVNIPRALSPYYTQGEVIWLKEAEGSGDKRFEMGVKFLRVISKNDFEDF